MAEFREQAIEENGLFVLSESGMDDNGVGWQERNRTPAYRREMSRRQTVVERIFAFCPVGILTGPSEPTANCLITPARAPRQGGQQVAYLVQELQGTELYRMPGASETLDLKSAVMALNRRKLESGVIYDTFRNPRVAPHRGSPAKGLPLTSSRTSGITVTRPTPHLPEI